MRCYSRGAGAASEYTSTGVNGCQSGRFQAAGLANGEYALDKDSGAALNLCQREFSVRLTAW